MEHDQRDGAESTARHWIRVYTELARFADDVSTEGALTAQAAEQMQRHRAELVRRLRFWQKELAAILAAAGSLV